MTIVRELGLRISDLKMLIGLGARGSSIAGRYAINIIILTLFGTHALGEFSIFSATSIVGCFFIGLELGQISRRAIIEAKPEAVAVIVRDSILFFLLSSAIVSTIVLVLPNNLKYAIGVQRDTLVCLGILASTQLGYEVQRVHAALLHSLTAIILTSCTSALWIVVAGALWLLHFPLESLSHLYDIWLLSNLAVLAVSVLLLRDLPWTEAMRVPVDFARIVGWLRKSYRFFMASLLTLAMFYSDRFLLLHWRSYSEVGIYSFFANLSRSIDIFIVSVVFVTALPSMYRAYHLGDQELWSTELFKAVRYTALIVAGGLFTAIVTWYVAGFARNGGALIVNWRVFCIQMCAGVLLAASEVGHAILYAASADRTILWCSVVSVGTTLVLLVLLIPYYGMLGASLGVLVGATLLAATKISFSLQYLRIHRLSVSPPPPLVAG